MMCILASWLQSSVMRESRHFDRAISQNRRDHRILVSLVTLRKRNQPATSKAVRGIEPARCRNGRCNGTYTGPFAQGAGVIPGVRTECTYIGHFAITPAGWYSWADKNIRPDSPDMIGLRPVLDHARAAGIGLIGMKAGRFLAGRKWLGWGNPDAFDHVYGKKLMSSDLNTYQRSYAYVLAHGRDAVNADMQSMPHLEQNFAAAATAQEYFA